MTEAARLHASLARVVRERLSSLPDPSGSAHASLARLEASTARLLLALEARRSLAKAGPELRDRLAASVALLAAADDLERKGPWRRPAAPSLDRQGEPTVSSEFAMGELRPLVADRRLSPSVRALARDVVEGGFWGRGADGARELAQRIETALGPRPTPSPPRALPAPAPVVLRPVVHVGTETRRSRAHRYRAVTVNGEHKWWPEGEVVALAALCAGRKGDRCAVSRLRKRLNTAGLSRDVEALDVRGLQPLVKASDSRGRPTAPRN